MSDRVFIGTTGSGVTRTSSARSGHCEVETLLRGAEVRCLARDPLDRDRVYAGTDGNGVLRSNDRGITWQPAGLAGQAVRAIAASSTRPDVVYAGTRSARLFVSEDRGRSWDELAGFQRIPGRWLWFSPAEKPFVASVQGIALSPTDPGRIVAGIELGATVLSTDAGKTWTGHLRGALRDCHGLAFHPTDGNWMYEAGGTGGARLSAWMAGARG